MAASSGTVHAAPSPGLRGLVADWRSDRRTFQVAWGKAMMWIFLLSDTFIFGSFLTGYMTVRASTTVPWPNPSQVFALQVGGVDVPLTMAMAVNCAYGRDRRNAARLMFATAALGATFVGMQAYEWSKLIFELGVRPWGNPMGAPQFGSTFFMITGFHGLHVSAGVIYLLVVAIRLLRGRYERAGSYQIVEIAGLYWHFVDLVWVFIFALFYLW
jgi:cytochrome c oxidase subunit 3